MSVMNVLHSAQKIAVNRRPKAIMARYSVIYHFGQRAWHHPLHLDIQWDAVIWCYIATLRWRVPCGPIIWQTSGPTPLDPPQWYAAQPRDGRESTEELERVRDIVDVEKRSCLVSSQSPSWCVRLPVVASRHLDTRVAWVVIIEFKNMCILYSYRYKNACVCWRPQELAVQQIHIWPPASWKYI